MKKLIFLRNGIDDFKQVYTYVNNHYEINKKLKIDNTFLYYIDDYIREVGYNKAAQDIQLQLNEWYVTSYPTILQEDIWWDNINHKWEIYFVDNNELKNIQEYTQRELRQAHNIERLYLSGELD